MTVKLKAFYFGMFFIFFLPLPSFSEEVLTLTTYYPSPYGSYRELSAQRMKVGVKFSGYPIADNNLIVEGKIGVGTTAPSEALEVNGHVLAGPIVGEWVPAYTTGVGFYVWDTENVNTDPNYFARADSNTSIQILKAGYYMVQARLLVEGCSKPGIIVYGYLSRNGNMIDREKTISIADPSPGTVRALFHLSRVDYFEANDKIGAYASTCDRAGNGRRSVLTIYKLN
ncbi:MAG: hypothetical protein JW788_05520 [Candidatus Omnitrophica bacterium]|nr:hypothetical protein [Candidatus Omnitrophota bacterium]